MRFSRGTELCGIVTPDSNNYSFKPWSNHVGGEKSEGSQCHPHSLPSTCAILHSHFLCAWQYQLKSQL